MVCPSWISVLQWNTVLQNCVSKITGTYFDEEAAWILVWYYHELLNIHRYHTVGTVGGWIQNRIRKVFRSGVKFHRWPPMTSKVYSAGFPTTLFADNACHLGEVGSSLEFDLVSFKTNHLFGSLGLKLRLLRDIFWMFPHPSYKSLIIFAMIVMSKNTADSDMIRTFWIHDDNCLSDLMTTCNYADEAWQFIHIMHFHIQFCLSYSPSLQF